MVCSAVGTEPTLAPLAGVRFRFRRANASEEARLDVSAGGGEVEPRVVGFLM